MKVKLLRDARIKHFAGETVEVSPTDAHFLISTGSAVSAEEVKAEKKKEKKENKGK